LSNDLTKKAVERHLDAIPSASYELGVLVAGKTPTGEPKDQMLLRQMDKETILKSVPWLRLKNSQGCAIYIRPQGEHQFNLIDDLKKPTIEKMKGEGFQPAAVVETSPGNFQAWMNHGRVLDKGLSTETAKAFAKQFGGDENSADWRHFGRLAGFTNGKPKYKDERGFSPFVKLTEAAGVVYDKAGAFVATTERAYEQQLSDDRARREAWRNAPADSAAKRAAGAPEKLKSIEDFRKDSRYSSDMTRADMAYATYAVDRGVSPPAIAAAIRTRDLSHKGGDARQTDYVERTIKKASERSRGLG
jgi:hypothetical protein